MENYSDQHKSLEFAPLKLENKLERGQELWGYDLIKAWHIIRKTVVSLELCSWTTIQQILIVHRLMVKIVLAM